MSSPVGKRTIDQVYSPPTPSSQAPDSPISRVAARAFSTPPRSDRKKTTPARKTNIYDPITLFPNLLGDSDSQLKVNISGPTNIILKTTDYGLFFPLIKQPPQKSSCGTAACLMATLTHQDFNQETLDNINDDFMHWYTSASLASAKDLHKQLTTLAQEPKWITFRSDDRNDSDTDQNFIDVQDAKGAVAEIKNILENYNKTMILAITHEKLDGHWVVLNHIDKDTFLLRDPYSGKGFKVSPSDLESMVLIDVSREHALLISKQEEKPTEQKNESQ